MMEIGLIYLLTIRDREVVGAGGVGGVGGAGRGLRAVA